MRTLFWLLLGLTLPLTAAAQWFTPISQDKQLGDSLVRQIKANPAEYPILDEAQYPEAYRFLRGMTDEILNSGAVETREQFNWEVYIINRDIKNAFCAPGGKIFVYTGLIKFLAADNELAGVLGHEIAHADKRHTARQLEQNAGLQLLTGLGAQALGGGRAASLGTNLLNNVVGLGFSRNHENEADAMSVRYLCNTRYAADGAAAFFEKIRSEGGRSGPSFLSTHPDPGNRIQRIRTEAKRARCAPKKPNGITYAAFVASLPAQYADPAPAAGPAAGKGGQQQPAPASTGRAKTAPAKGGR